MADGGGASLPGDPVTQAILGLTPGVQATLSGRQQQSGAEQQQHGLSHGGTDPAYIASMEAFEGFSHEEIYNAVQKMQPGVMQQFGDQWVAMAVEISGAVTGLMIQTARAASSLQGATASAGEAAGKRFVTEVSDVSTVLSVVGHRVKAAAYGSEAVKAAVPPPSSTAGTTSGESAIPPVLEILVEGSAPASAADAAREKEELRQQAIAAMNATYKPTYQPSGENVPAFVAPTQPGTGNPNGTGDGSGGGTNPGGDGDGSGAGDDTNDGEDENPGEDDDTENPTTSDDDSSSDADQDGGGSGDTQDQGGDDTNPANTVPSATNPAGTTPSNPGPGGGSPGGAGGASPGTGGTPTAGTPVAGRPIAGALPNAAVAGVVGAAGGAAGNRGMGMMPPGARGQGDERDDEHASPDYLRRVQPELLGPDQPAVSGAIGADAPATRLAGQDQEPGAE